jgi:predicted nucleic acid-binding protein
MISLKGKKVLVDTNVLIYQLNGGIDISNELAEAESLCISAVTQAELYAGTAKSDFLNLKDYLVDFCVLPVSAEIATIAGAYCATFTHRSLKDLLIAATAQVHKLTLVTANKKDFFGLTTLKAAFVEVGK